MGAAPPPRARRSQRQVRGAQMLRGTRSLLRFLWLLGSIVGRCCRLTRSRRLNSARSVAAAAERKAARQAARHKAATAGAGARAGGGNHTALDTVAAHRSHDAGLAPTSAPHVERLVEAASGEGDAPTAVARGSRTSAACPADGTDEHGSAQTGARPHAVPPVPVPSAQGRDDGGLGQGRGAQECDEDFEMMMVRCMARS